MFEEEHVTTDVRVLCIHSLPVARCPGVDQAACVFDHEVVFDERPGRQDATALTLYWDDLQCTSQRGAS